MPPGTGDVALSLARLVPGAELVIVTTPQVAAAEVAKRAGTLVTQTHQRVVGVIENMSYLLCPHCGEAMDVFGSGGGETVATALTQLTGVEVPLLGQVPLDVRLREGGDSGNPLVLADPSAPGLDPADQGRRVAREQGPRPGRPDAEPQPAVAGRSGTGQVASRSNGGSSPSSRVARVPFATAAPPRAASRGVRRGR